MHGSNINFLPAIGAQVPQTEMEHALLAQSAVIKVEW